VPLPNRIRFGAEARALGEEALRFGVTPARAQLDKRCEGGRVDDRRAGFAQFPAAARSARGPFAGRSRVRTGLSRVGAAHELGQLAGRDALPIDVRVPIEGAAQRHGDVGSLPMRRDVLVQIEKMLDVLIRELGIVVVPLVPAQSPPNGDAHVQSWQ